MIGSIKGKLTSKGPNQVLIEVHGLGYEVDIPTSTFYDLPDPGDEVFLLTHLQVREDAHILYGFMREQERSLFRLLIKVSGIGARTALGVLSGISVEQFEACVQTKDHLTLTKLPGVGKKTAERLVIELKDKIGGDRINLASSDHGFKDSKNEAFSALLVLGYKSHEAKKVLETVDPSIKTVEEILKVALKSLHSK
jgi:Holliday junction DNA helicase RuvA